MPKLNLTMNIKKISPAEFRRKSKAEKKRKKEIMKRLHKKERAG